VSLNIFEGLNKEQKEAVETTEGALLVLAGAGTGKTKVLTSRIVNILNQKLANPTEILAVTFTNKAAKEMMQRVEGLLGYSANGFWIGTFHSIGLRILRRHYLEAGLGPNFTILDTSDCESIIKQILIEKNIDTKKYPPKMVADKISRLKDRNILPDSISNEDNQIIGNIYLKEIYTAYQRQLRELNCVDFGDLLLLCVDLFRQFPDTLAHWQERFKYIMVDEYQDTNAVQYLFIKILAYKHRNICAVGDDDQSIYSWRGADITNILRFEKDFLGAKIIRLEQNYRSTTPILKVASSVISQNSDRHDKTLWSEKNSESNVKLYEAFNSKQEADFIATTINDLIRKGYRYNQVAILVRSAFLTREIEERLMFNAVPYKFIGGSRFYDRLEIKDIIAYLRLVYQPLDDMAYLRIINTPKRGIGGASLDKIRNYARSNNLSFYNASIDLIGKSVVPAKVEKELTEFVNNFENWKKLLDSKSLGEITKIVAEESCYMEMWETENTVEAKGRIENIKELYTALESFSSLEEFLEHVSLVSDIEEENEDNKVVVMTLHGAKGLEFDVVFLAGWEDGIFPNQRSLEDTGDSGLQEERRLAYVGITRAKNDLYITFARNRQVYGNWQSSIGSRFIEEMNYNFVEKLNENESSNRAYEDPFINKAFYGERAKTTSGEGFAKNVNNIASGLKAGVRVNHSTMGEGEIITINGPIATVRFDKDGEKKIMASFLSVIKDS
jgi:DNA helicase-2/ATP-dependent DNA helicase PcrA